jgi:hypothetical protein
LLKKNCSDIEGDIVEVEVVANSNGKRKTSIFTLIHDRIVA